MKKTITFLLILAATTIYQITVFAHEFWLAPSRFRLAVGDTLDLSFLVGESFRGEFWGKRRERTLSLTHFFSSTSQNLTAKAIATDSTPITIAFKKTGTHVLTMQSKNSFIALDAAKFNAYLEEDGLPHILALRKKQNQLDSPSRENYRRYAKTLIQVGEAHTADFKRNTGMKLEIIPLQNPYSAKLGDSLTVQVLFNQKPLAKGKLVTWHKTENTETIKSDYTTDRTGKVRFALDKKGAWMVSLVHMVEVKNSPKANYQSYWGNLTFEL